jgi:hypothetical protein
MLGRFGPQTTLRHMSISEGPRADAVNDENLLGAPKVSG